MKYAILVCVALACLGMAAPPDPFLDVGAWMEALVKGFGARDWLLVGGLAVLGVTALLRWQSAWLVKRVPWLGTRAGGYVLAFAVAALTALGGALFGKLPWMEALKQTLIQGFLASGLWTALKDYSAPKV